MWEVEGDRAARQHDEGERGASGVDPEGASHDEPDAVIESFEPAVREAEFVHLEADLGVLGIKVLVHPALTLVAEYESPQLRSGLSPGRPG